MRALSNLFCFVGRICIITASFLLPAAAQIVQRDTTDQFGTASRLEINRLTGTAHRIWWSNPNIERFGFQRRQLNSQNVQALAIAVLSSYKDLLKVGPSHLVFGRAETDGENWYVSFEQRYKNLPVYNTSAGFTINAEGKIVSIGADAYPEVEVETVPTITDQQAEEIAKSDFAAADQDTIFHPSPNHLLVYPRTRDDAISYHLAYAIELQSNSPSKGLRYFIDAHSGAIVEREELFRDGIWNINGNVSGQYWPEQENVNTTTVTPNYLTALTITNTLGQTVASGAINGSGNYSITWNAAYATYFLQRKLQSSWIKIKSGSNIVKSPFQFLPSANTVHNFQFSSGNDGYNVYHHANVIHNFFKGSPFNYNGMDYQMEADINGGSGVNGEATGINMKFGSQSGILWLGASDVVYHEYTHNTIYHLYGNKFIGTSGGAQGDAMDEGLSDYFAATINGNSSINLVDRDLSPNLSYPDDYDFTSNADPHENGLIIGGAAWDLQQLLGTTTGRKLIFKALQMTPHAFNFTDFVNNVIVADDNNGTLCDQTPNTSAIEQAFDDNHGISPTILPQTPTVSITGPSSIAPGVQGTWSANVCGGSGTITYQWSVRYDGSSTFTNLGTSQNQSLTFPDDCTINDLKVDVVRGGQSAQDIQTVIVSNGPIFCKRAAEEVAQIPDKFDLHQNFPNPFNPETEIRFDLPEEAHLQVVIIDLLGREVRNLVDKNATAGYHSVVWDGRDNSGQAVASGVYLYQMSAGNFREVKKLTLVR